MERRLPSGNTAHGRLGLSHPAGSELLQTARELLRPRPARRESADLTTELDHVPEDLVAGELAIADLAAVHSEQLERKTSGGKWR